MTETEEKQGVGGVNLPTLLSQEFEISRSEARRLIAQGGVKIDGATVTQQDVPRAVVDGQSVAVGRSRNKIVRAPAPNPTEAD